MSTFMGYRRANGDCGTRNHVLVLPTIGCANELAFEIAARVPGSIALTHNHACIRVGEDAARARRTLIGVGKNPNIACVLVVGIGCEPILPTDLAAEIAASQKPVHHVSIEEEGNFDRAVDKGAQLLGELAALADQEERVPCPLSKLIVGIKCGGSGAVSAIASNPSVGRGADLLIAEGGTVIFTETAELLGAEQVLASRGATPAVSSALLDCVDRMKRNIARCGVDILGSEPTAGNIKNGLTTIEEKSLGAIVKGGTTPLIGVLEYGQAPHTPGGLYFMDGTTQAGQLFLGMFTAGAQIQIFSYAGGLPARIRGLPSYPPGLKPLPVIKVLGSPEDADEQQYFDVYAGDILRGKESIADVGARVFGEIVAVASGKRTITETRTRYSEMVQVYADGLLM